MEPTTQNTDQNSSQPSSDKGNFIPFTEVQLAVLNARHNKYFAEAREKISYDLMLASDLDERVQAAVKAGKTVKVAGDMTGFLCE